MPSKILSSDPSRLYISHPLCCYCRADAAAPPEKLGRGVPSKRVQTWEETVKQKASRPEATRAIANGTSAGLKAEASVAEEDGALPEEGELPDT